MKDIKKVILLGSGGLSIGQAGEFDYSGCQAIKSLEEQGISVVIVNPNIATVQTTPENGRKIYLYPVEPEWVEKVIAVEKPDGLIAGFGGQTALNCAIQLDEAGILKKYEVRNLGTAVEVLRLTEDRDLFAKKMMENGIPVPPSRAATTVQQSLDAAASIGYPVIIRAAFALGGLGSGFAKDASELQKLSETALSTSPQILVEKSLRGWKEVEYEVMRDSFGNAITICNMENFDPLGVHTGDSIVVAPSQTLTDDEFQLLRNTSIQIVQLLKIVGECNVQFALNPDSLEFYVIEINARLSRSSALASKATGYPIAFIAAKVVLGKSLLEIKNPVTQNTTAYFEPALDYITVKIPRWDLQKFKGASRIIGTTMKSIGEVMSIGRSFPEALQKAVRMISEDGSGLSHDGLGGKDDFCGQPTDTRLFEILHTLRKGMSVQKTHEHTQIDQWFLYQLSEIIACETEIEKLGTEMSQKVASPQFQRGAFVSLIRDSLSQITYDTWQKWKSYGFGDEQIARLCLRKVFPVVKKIPNNEILEASLVIRESRKKQGVRPFVKKIDTTAAEFPSHSNYLFFTYNGQCHDEITSESSGSNGRSTDGAQKSALVLGGGSYRIGSSVEFDWCAVSCLKQLQESGWRCSVINFNPETVSTDYNVSDRLYFEELTLERILDVMEFENPTGVIVSMSGQLPNKLAPQLANAGVPLLGHKWESIDKAEDREKFSALLDSLKILQPKWVEAKSTETIQNFIKEVGYPVLIRPSYVLSGAAMNVVTNDESLDFFLSLAQDVSQEHPVILSQYYEGAQEIELDAVAQNGTVLSTMISEHIENAGVHSGDATIVFPVQSLAEKTQHEIEQTGILIAQSLQLNGPFNIQFLVKDGEVRVIECNVRASRSFPFVSKLAGINLASLATEAMITTEKLSPRTHAPIPYVGVKSAMFSFQRLAGADPVLGVEMASTGEVACLGSNVDEAILLSFQASGIRPPKKGVLISAGRPEEKHKLLPVAHILRTMQIPLYATPNTAKFFKEHGFEVEEIDWNDVLKKIVRLIQNDKIDFVINIPKNYTRTELGNGYQVRMAAIQYGCTLMTNAEKANAFLKALVSAGGQLRASPIRRLL